MNPLARALPLLLAPAVLGAASTGDARAAFERARLAATGGKILRDVSFERSTRIAQPNGELAIVSQVEILASGASRTEVRSPAGAAVLVYDGKTVRKLDLAGKQELPPQAADLQRRELARMLVLYGPAPDPATVRSRGEADVGGRPVDVVELLDVGDTALRLFIDRQTGDVLKRMYVGDAPDGTMAQVEEFLSDYIEVDGFRWPTRIRVTRNGKPGPASEIRGIRVNRGLTPASLTR